MGAGASIPELQEATSASITLSSTSETSSGYHSYTEDKDTITKLPSIQHQTKVMAKRPLASRPSLIIGAITKQQQDKEEELEKKNVLKTPELRKVFEGFEQCKKFLTDASKRNEQFYESLNHMLQDNMIKIFTKFDKDEQRMVMANRLARIK
jgi:hypothetical protein